jgi:hypothetical protein
MSELASEIIDRLQARIEVQDRAYGVLLQHNRVLKARILALEAQADDSDENHGGYEAIWNEVQRLSGGWAESNDMAWTDEIMVGLSGAELRIKELEETLRRAKLCVAGQVGVWERDCEFWETRIKELEQKCASLSRLDRNDWIFLRRVLGLDGPKATVPLAPYGLETQPGGSETVQPAPPA